ncbi:KH domain-containing protein [Granulicella tundricola]|uniref:RNA-binding protein KhpA n=1 Tax=Granulicella tundricola (strain ATCC BAA-1859 / DSM 23138 / MP5ACTX9) TaxID=1198114 RepID=E8X776_GRATM|nr:KH domain-containing protein [Granulicella tundricola]ADW71310.1 hypothetical protein AciX9_4358 [Granulicella tundricola MP5ACTX9]
MSYPASTQQDADTTSLFRNLILEIAQSLVDDSEQVKVDIIKGELATVLRLTVASTDLGKVIGKQGRTARSIRTVLGAASMKVQQRFELDIASQSE